MKTLKTGDRVKITHGGYKGTKGTIVKVVRNGVNYKVDHDQGHSLLQHHKHVEKIEEEAPVNCTSGGNVAGMGQGPDGEPGVDKKKKKKVIPFDTFARGK